VDTERFISLAVALGVGFLIGLQREQSAAMQGTPGRSYPGGVRTYPLVALSGALAVLLSARFGPWLVVVGVLFLLIPLSLAYADDVRQNRDRGITSEVALVVTYFLGCLSTADGVGGSPKERLLLCAAMAVAVTALLSYKDPLHTLASRISRDDLYATVKFGILAAVMLPLLPDKGYGPYAALNPAKIGLFVVLVAGVGFAGYIAVRVLGSGKGLGVTGLLGGLVSSTAITFSFSGRAKREPASAQACALGIVLASTVMGLRLLGLIAVTNSALLPLAAIPVGALTLGGFAAGAILYFTGKKDGAGAESVQFVNPFELSSAFKFGLIFALVLLGSKAAIQAWGQQGGYLAALLAGTVDVDAVSISLARMPATELPLREAALGITVACVSNSLVKAGIAVVLGGWAFGWRVVVAFLAMVTAGAAGALYLVLRS
jgi:uncharacterized membrane protein (DUF4010 family)